MFKRRYFITALLLSSFFCKAQQIEPKRVSIVVTLKEITPISDSIKQETFLSNKISTAAVHKKRKASRKKITIKKTIVVTHTKTVSTYITVVMITHPKNSNK